MVSSKKSTGGYTPLPAPKEIPSQGETEQSFDVLLEQFTPLKKPGATNRDRRGPALAGRVRAQSASFHLRDGPTDPLAFFRISDLGVPPVIGGVHEPTAAVGGSGVTMVSGNSRIAFSTNNGRTFTTLNPSTVLPDPPDQPFCCDQVVAYSPRFHLFFWLMQYWCRRGTSSPSTNRCDGAGTLKNRLRIAVASPDAIKANATNFRRRA